MFEWEISGKTDPGKVREANEDCISANNELGYAILADGMGGHQGGEIASAMAVSGISQDLEAAAGTFDAGDMEHQTEVINKLLEQTISRINKEIFFTAEANDQYRGMGTTIVVALTHNNILHYAHVGDSRLYRFRNNKLELLTRDHSLVNELLEQGYYKTLQEAENAGQKNVITRAVGIAGSVKVDTAQIDVEENDAFLLCSDGLNDMIKDDLIANCLQSASDHEELLTALIDKACIAGGRDNISVMLIEAKKSSLIKKSLNWLFKS